MQNVKYSIVIPTYNHLEDCLKPCIESIIRYTDLSNVEVIVVANGCTDGTRQYVESLGEHFRLIWADAPLGYIKPTNMGIREAKGEYVVLLNNDVILCEQPKNLWLFMLESPFIKDPKTGITGPYKDILFYWESGRINFRNEFIAFFCAMFKRSIISLVGLLDEDFGLGYEEDVEFCTRITKAGFKVVEVPDDMHYDLNITREYLEANPNINTKYPLIHLDRMTFKHITLPRQSSPLLKKHRPPKYSIIIPTYNHLEDCLKPCIESIIRYTDLSEVEVIIVANGCTDGTEEYVRNLGYPFKLLHIKEAAGYTKSTNEGIKVSQGKYVILLNNDNVIMESPKHEWIKALERPFREQSNVGITGVAKDVHYGTGCEFLLFFCVMIDYNVFRKIGFLDEVFNPGYGEDIDFCNKVKRNGLKVVQVPEDCTLTRPRLAHEHGLNFPIWHKGSKTVSTFKDWDKTVPRNEKILFERYGKASYPKYSIVIPTYNHFQDCLKPCIESVIRHTNLSNVEVIVVANGCTDGTREYVESLGSPFRLIWNEAPLGYIKPTNMGIREAKGEYVILLNNDTQIVAPGWIEILASPFASGNIGITGPRKAWRDDVKKEYILFFCAMIKKEVFNKIGLLDESFGIGYNEDTDFCIRAVKAGYELVEVPYDIKYSDSNKGNDSREMPFPICHTGGRTFSSMFESSAAGASKNVHLLYAKHCPKVYDCFMFFNELDLLEIRLNELDEVVDKFVLIEARYTHQGKPKPLYFDENKQRFAKFLHKIDHIVVEEFPEAKSKWDNEIFQRNAAMNVLKDAIPNAVVILSDVDEIPSKSAILEYFSLTGIYTLEQRVFYYHLNCEIPDSKWTLAKICRYSDIGNRTINDIRTSPVVNVLKNAGCHFSYIGGSEQIISKIKAFSHLEYNQEHIVNKNAIESRVSECKDVFGRDISFQLVEDLSYLPSFVLNNLDKYRRLGLIRSAKEDGRPKVYDCFMFFNEMDVLEIRLNELDEVVDRFVLVEAKYTHQGKPKPLYFDENKQRFAKFLHKIDHIVVEEFPETNDPWVREPFQRNQIMRGLKNCKPDDIIIVSDVDEIPKASVVKQYRKEMGLTCIQTRLFYYKLNYLCPVKWFKLRIFPFSELRGGEVQQVRGSRDYDYKTVIDDGGWHFSFLGDREHIRQKIESYGHIEFNNDLIKSDENIDKAINEGRDVFGRPQVQFETVAIDDSFPKFVIDNLDKYRKAGLIGGTKMKTMKERMQEEHSGTYDEMYMYDVYSLEDKDIRNKVIVDIGANFGFFSFRCLEMGAKKCYCFEPQSDNYKKLVELIDEFGFKEKIDAKKLAVLDGSVSEVVMGGKDVFSNIWGQGDSNKVKCISFQEAFSYVKENEDLVLKVDCEGSEFEIIFNSPPEILKRFSFMYIEIHDDMNPNYKGRMEDLIKYIEDLGFIQEKHGPQFGMFWADGSFTPSPIKCIRFRRKAEASLPDGWFGEEDVSVYKSLVSAVPENGKMAEIGVWQGRSLCSVAKIIKDKNLQVAAIDTFKGSEGEKEHTSLAEKISILDAFKNNILRFGLEKNISIYSMTSASASAAIPNRSLDFVFIDANHSYEYVLQDIKLWLPKVKDGGVIAGHDFLYSEGVRTAVHETFGNSFDVQSNLWFTTVKRSSVTPSTPKYSIVIPTYNHLDDCLKPCIESIIKHTDLSNVEVIVVANGCTDGTRSYVEGLGSPFKLVWMDESAGYTRAANEGIKASKGEFVVLLNNDVILLDYQKKNEWLDLMARPFSSKDKVGVTGPSKNYCNFLDAFDNKDGEFLIFFCVMIPRKLFDELGLLDERFNPGAGEDFDFCIRAKAAGYSLVQVPDNDQYVHSGPGVATSPYPLWHKNASTRGEDHTNIKINNVKLINKYKTKNLKINFINAEQNLPGFFSADMDTSKTHLMLDARKMDLEDNSVTEIVLQNLLERFGINDITSVIKESNRVLTDGGKIVVVTEDGAKDFLVSQLLATGFSSLFAQYSNGKLHLSAVKEKRKVFDCFPFFNELDLLEIRLNELDPYVDYFVLSEMTITHQGKPKPLYFNENKQRFAKFLHKIVHVIVDDCPRFSDPWLREHYQRNVLDRGLKDCKPKDIIILSDIDEIPRGEKIKEYDPSLSFMCFEMNQYNYYLNMNVGIGELETGVFGRITTLENLRKMNAWLTDLRYAECGKDRLIHNGGWHFSWIGGANRIIEKLESYAHEEINQDQYKKIELINKNISESTDAFGRENPPHKPMLVEVDNSFPKFIRDNYDDLVGKGLIKPIEKSSKVAIIMPYYNDSSLMISSVMGILNQTYRDWVLFLVDDGSSENNKAAKVLGRHYPSRIRIIEKENGGVSSARNAALDLVRKDPSFAYIAYCDSDDVWDEGYLESQIEAIQNCDLVYCYPRHEFDNGEKARVSGLEVHAQ